MDFEHIAKVLTSSEKSVIGTSVASSLIWYVCLYLAWSEFKTLDFIDKICIPIGIAIVSMTIANFAFAIISEAEFGRREPISAFGLLVPSIIAFYLAVFIYTYNEPTFTPLWCLLMVPFFVGMLPTIRRLVFPHCGKRKPRQQAPKDAIEAED